MTTIAFQTKLKSGTIHLPDVDDLIGKEVLITVVEIQKKQPAAKRHWNFIGTADLHKNMDNKNIRDFAHD